MASANKSWTSKLFDAYVFSLQQVTQNSSSNISPPRNITLLPPSLNVTNILKALDDLFEMVVTVFNCIDHEYFEGYTDEESMVRRAINTSELPAIASKCMLTQFNPSNRNQHVYSPHCSPYIFYGNNEENLLNNQDLCYMYLLISTFFLIEQCYCKKKLNIGHR